MITNAQEKLIRNLLTKKGRRAEGLCLAEGRKLVSDIGDFVDFTVSPEDTRFFDEFTDTQTPQNVLAVARIPKFDEAAVLGGKQIVFLDHVQDPGNVGAFFRLALAFDATLILRECADPYSPKVVRASAGASFRVPNIECNIEDGKVLLQKSGRKVLKFELNDGAVPFDASAQGVVLMFGNEGNGIMGDYEGQSVFIKHNPALESLSVGHAGAIAMHNVYAAK